MDQLHWPLSVLGKAIHYKNLSAAADNIGLSQPQLSRLISQLESELGVILLDRTARRKSGWTAVAYKIADIYFQSSRRLSASLSEVKGDDQLSHLTIGILEGLIPLAIEITQTLLKETKIPVIEVNVFDLSDLEEHFGRGEIDLILTCREPGRTKYKNVREFGWQDFETLGPAQSSLKVLSPFEYAHAIQTAKKQTTKKRLTESAPIKTVVSNSLLVRRLYIEEEGGSGQVPSPVQRKRPGTKTEQPVYLIGTEILPPMLWNKVLNAKITHSIK